MNNKTHILCAAVYYDDGVKRQHMPHNITSGIVVSGMRHCNCITVLAVIFPNYEYKKGYTQGFLTSDGRFVNRAEAAKIALDCGQIDKLKFFKEELDSSDLY